MSPQPAEVWLVDLGFTAKRRPVIIVSRNDPDAPRALATYVPVTTKNRGSRYEVPLNLAFLTEESTANVQGIGSVEFKRLERRIGIVPHTLFMQIQDAIAFSLDIAR